MPQKDFSQDWGGQRLPDTTTVYHGTSRQNAESIVNGQSWLPGSTAWFTTDRDRASFYGDATIALDLPSHMIPKRQPEFAVPARSRVLRKGPFRHETAKRQASANGMPITDTGFKMREDGGRWNYQYDPERSKDTYHSWGIHPSSAPASHTYTDQYGRTNTVHYDPELSGGHPQEGEFRHEWAHNPSNKIDDLSPPKGMLWRGMSKEEYEGARQNGYFQSKGDANIGDSQVGKTYFSTNPDQAANYASWFALPEHKPTFSHPGYVVGIPDRPDIAREQDTEVGVPGQVPFDSATHHYRVRPWAIDPGQQGMSDYYGKWERGGGSQPSAQYLWDQVR